MDKRVAPKDPHKLPVLTSIIAVFLPMLAATGVALHSVGSHPVGFDSVEHNEEALVEGAQLARDDETGFDYGIVAERSAENSELRVVDLATNVEVSSASVAIEASLIRNAAISQDLSTVYVLQANEVGTTELLAIDFTTNTNSAMPQLTQSSLTRILCPPKMWFPLTMARQAQHRGASGKSSAIHSMAPDLLLSASERRSLQ